VALWSDGAEKQRWILLPEGKTIDAGNVDNWVFPVGTKAWKEFRIQGRRIETRLFWKVRDDRWMAASYRWSVDERAALRGEGSRVVLPDGAPYDIPSTTQCDECHKGRKDRLLGFEAVSLGQRGATGLSLETLVDEGRLSPAPAVRVLPLEERAGEPAAAALAWLHVQCGVSCHNSNSTATGYTTRLRLKLGFDEVLQLPRDQWQVHRTTVGVSAHQPKWAGGVRVVPQQPEQSLLFQLMVREGEGRMPPLGSHELDPDGVARVREWISRLPKDSGPPGDDAGPDAGAGRESGDTSDAGLEDAAAVSR
jgi:hypothetical protein